VEFPEMERTMDTKADRYTAHFSAVPLLSGGFVGLATLVWHEKDATFRQTQEFFDEFATAAEAERHARDRTSRRRQVVALAG
jgi:hypothetical protein